MRAYVGCLVLFFLLYLYVLTPLLVNGFEDGSCYTNESLPIFRYAPGGYDPEQEPGGPIDPVRCARLCADNEMPVSAIASRIYCLCAYADEAMAALDESPAISGADCEAGLEGYLRVYKGEIIHAVEGLQVSMSPSPVGFTDELVTFNVTLSRGVDVQFTLDYGDGTPETEWNATRRSFNHTYHGSGYFRVKLYARQPSKLERRAVIKSLLVKIVDRVEMIDIDFRCFPVIEPEEDSGCNVTALGGQDLKAVLDFDDSSEPLEFEIPGE